MANFEEALKNTLKWEGGLVDDARDPGGITKYGISFQFLKRVPIDRLRKYGFQMIDDKSFEVSLKEFIRNLSPEQAKLIYRGEFWEMASFDDITQQDQANYIFDMAVNMGLETAIRLAQQSIWAVLRDHNLKADGILGHNTIDALKKCGFLLLPALRATRASYHLNVAVMYDKHEYLKTWLNRTYGL